MAFWEVVAPSPPGSSSFQGAWLIIKQRKQEWGCRKTSRWGVLGKLEVGEFGGLLILGVSGGALSMIWSWKAQLSGSFTPRVELVNWSQVSSGLRCCSLFFRLSDPMSGCWRRWLLGGRSAKGLPVGYVKHTQSLSTCRGIMINKACPTPAPGSTMETPRANEDTEREQLLEAPINEMDYINPFCCSSAFSSNIKLTDCTSHSEKPQ